jgi:hypothetical protein
MREFSETCRDGSIRITIFKGIVQRKVTGVENRLKRSVFVYYIVAKFPFFILKGHYCERSVKPVSASKAKFINIDWTY